MKSLTVVSIYKWLLVIMLNQIWFKENDAAVVLLTVLHGPAERGLGERPLPEDVDGLQDHLVLAVLPQPRQHKAGAVARVVELVHVQEAVVLRAAKEGESDNECFLL